MMMTSQANALTEAQAQPSESSSPKRARRRGTTVPGPSACCAIFLHPRPPTVRRTAMSLSRQGPRHARVDRTDERVAPGRKSRDLVLPCRDAREDLPLEGDAPARVLDFDVVRY